MNTSNIDSGAISEPPHHLRRVLSAQRIEKIGGPGSCATT
jgi:hypothetical protein